MTSQFQDKIKQLGRLFEERDAAYLENTRKIFEILTPTVVEAVLEFFNIENLKEQIEWQGIGVIEGAIVINAIIYRPVDLVNVINEEVREALRDLQDDDNPALVSLQQMIKLVVPTYLIFEDKETIKKWLKSSYVEVDGSQASSIEEAEQIIDNLVAANTKDSKKRQTKKQPQDEEFDVSGLSKEQLAQVLYFQDPGKIKKQ